MRMHVEGPTYRPPDCDLDGKRRRRGRRRLDLSAGRD
jgi:hypothetical protein